MLECIYKNFITLDSIQLRLGVSYWQESRGRKEDFSLHTVSTFKLFNDVSHFLFNKQIKVHWSKTVPLTIFTQAYLLHPFSFSAEKKNL